MKKILFILHYPPPVHGAAMVGQYIRESNTVNSAFDCKYINLSLSYSIDEIGKNGLNKWTRFFSIFWNSLRAIFSFKPDLVYLTLTSNGIGFFKDATIALLAKLMGKKIIFHFHNKGISNTKNGSLKDFVSKLIFKNSNVILLSKYLYYDIKKYVPLSNVSFCPNGTPAITISAAKETKLNKCVELLFLSNLIESKGVYLLLEACKLLSEKNIPFSCTFVGGEGDITAVAFDEKVRQLNLEEKVKYIGKKYGKEKEEVYHNADIFVLPTFYDNECFPLVLLEAMQFSLPVVTTREGGIREIVEDGSTGSIMHSLEANTLVKKLEELILNPEKGVVMGKKGLKRYESYFTLNKFELRLKEILMNIL